MLKPFVAAITNPNETSFRSHLTELSFRRHLAYFRSSSDDTSLSEDDALSGEASGQSTTQAHAPIHTPYASEIAPVAPFRFASHVSVSLRTPPLHYRGLFFLSLALTSPLAPPIFLPDLAPTPTGRKCPWPKERVVLYIGYFGYWVRLGMFPRRLEWVWRLFTDGPRDKGKRKTLLDKPGVMGMRAITSKEEAPVGSKRDSLLSPTKILRKSDSNINLIDGPLSAHAPIPSFVADSRAPSMVNLVPSSPQPDVDANSPLLVALKAELSAAQSALSELQTQLLSHEESVSRAHSHLQTQLDEHRNRRKEDDAERQELKSKTKNLDEQKRQAEAARREAEKKLRAAENLRDGLESKIASAEAEIKGLSGLVEQSGRNVAVVQEEGTHWVKSTRGTADEKKIELDDLEIGIGHLDEGNTELLTLIKEAEARIAQVLKDGEEAKKLGPEEEMMMMAAAYEAAAQEGYHEGRGPAPHHGAAGGGHRDQWANQAAAYMAEAGMPTLDPNYTARPSHSTSFGHLARSRQGSGDERASGRGGDYPGYENFGPGAPAARPQAPSTPPQSSDSGSDVWGLDPASPNGGISSSLGENLLPQGLFHSLEGDQTPLGEVIDVPPTHVSPGASIRANGHGSRFIEAHDDSSDSSSEHDQWRSPAVMAGRTDGTGRLPPPTSTTPPHAPALPGLFSLPTTRRWFSGTHSNSAENINVSTFPSSTSNDSLLVRTISPYETGAFAPSALEKKALALNWGPLSRSKWGKPDTGSGGGGEGQPRNLSLNTNWLSSRLPTGSPFHPLKTSVSSDILRPSSNTSHGSGSSALHALAITNGLGQVDGGGEGVAQETDNLGESPKKPFRFFSLRRPNSSGQGSNGSGQLSSSQGSNG